MNDLLNKELNKRLVSACRYGKFNIIEEMIEQGANIHATSSTPLILAAQHLHFHAVKYLIENGAKPFINHALPFCESNAHFNIVQLLIEHGADFQIANEYCDDYIKQWLLSKDLAQQLDNKLVNKTIEKSKLKV